MKMNIYVPFKEIGKREHRNASYNVSISYVDVRIHPMIKASFCDNIQESVANLSKYHEEMWLEPSVNVRIRAGFLHHSLPCLVLPSLTSSQPEGANKVYVHSKK